MLVTPSHGHSQRFHCQCETTVESDHASGDETAEVRTSFPAIQNGVMIRDMGRKHIVKVLILTGLLVSAFSFAKDAAAKDKPQAKRKPSTAVERASAVKAAHELENDPLGPGADVNRKVAMAVAGAPDIQAKMCANLLASFANETTPRHGELLQQLVFSTMAFTLEQPDRAKDDQAALLAGILGAIKAYNKMWSVEADSRSAFFDKLLDLQKRGTLEAYVRKESAPCVARR
jgi:hypothetical protein